MPELCSDFRSIPVADLEISHREGGYAKGQETREHILRAALHILIEEGFRAMSMRRVAAACGMRLGNLTYHYPSREDLVRDLLDSVIRAYESEFDAIVHMPGVPPEVRLAEVCALVLEDIRTKKTTGSVANMGHGRAASPSWGIRQHWRNAY